MMMVSVSVVMTRDRPTPWVEWGTFSRFNFFPCLPIFQSYYRLWFINDASRQWWSSTDSQWQYRHRHTLNSNPIWINYSWIYFYSSSLIRNHKIWIFITQWLHKNCPITKLFRCILSYSYPIVVYYVNDTTFLAIVRTIIEIIQQSSDIISKKQHSTWQPTNQISNQPIDWAWPTRVTVVVELRTHTAHRVDYHNSQEGAIISKKYEINNIIGWWMMSIWSQSK